jgi:YjjG family noncanonical pyrimidine nucleotidase
MPRYAAILLDLDDTLLDFGASQKSAFETTLGSLGVPPEDEIFQQFRAINHELWALYEQEALSKQDVFTTRWQRLFETHAVGVEPREINDRFLTDLAENPIWLDGAQEFCRELAAQFKLILVTNGDAMTARSRIKHSGLADLCHGVVISDEVGVAKPHPRIFEHALAVAGAKDKSAVLMIGDNFHADVGGALKFGIDACWFNPSGAASSGEFAPTFVARSHVEIRSWLGKY